MKKIAIFTSYFKIGQNMSGMGYRTWEFAQTLANYYKINLVVPQESDFGHSKNISFTVLNSSNIEKLIKNVDIVFTLPEVNDEVLLTAARLNKVIISDIAYNPIESLEKDAIKKTTDKERKYNDILKQYILQLLVSDLIIVESHEQRLFMLGALMALGRINYVNYYKSIDFSHLVCEIPIGFNKFALDRINKIRSKKSNSEKVILWNGGLWNHYDPIPIIKALKVAIKKDSEIKLIFMYSSPSKITSVAKKTIMLSKKLGLYNKNIFFRQDVITYRERDNILLSSKALICSNPYSVDAMIMRRLRFRDALIYELPILTSKGGSLPDVIEKLKIGVVFENNDINSIAKSILKIISDKDYYKKLKNNLRKAQKSFILENNINPLLKFIDSGKKTPDTNFKSIKKMELSFRYNLS